MIGSFFAPLQVGIARTLRDAKGSALPIAIIAVLASVPGFISFGPGRDSTNSPAPEREGVSLPTSVESSALVDVKYMASNRKLLEFSMRLRDSARWTAVAFDDRYQLTAAQYIELIEGLRKLLLRESTVTPSEITIFFSVTQGQEPEKQEFQSWGEMRALAKTLRGGG